MPRATTCPDMSQYQRLAAGQLVDVEKEGLLEHLEGCDACAARLNALPEQDTLVGLIRQGQTLGEDDSRENIARLVERLCKLRPGDSPAGAGPNLPPAESASLSFACPACGKGVKVKGEFAGKKVKCPHCKQVVCAAAKSAGAPERAPVPGVSASPATLPPKPGSLAGAGARINAAGKPVNTIYQQRASDPQKAVYDFLAPPQAPDELGRLGPYRVLQVLGAGGMGVVFRAEDPQLARFVALKALLPALAASESARQRFLREARAAAAIKHDHIVTIYQVGEDRGVPFLAMDFLEGEPLDARLKQQAKLPVAEVLRIGREIALGLAAAHQRELIHRDIKPANVWLETQAGKPGASATGGRVKILDFGLARAVGDEAQLTQPGAIVGTPAYMAPEQARGEKVDPRCDLFSLGCVLYRIATGEPPFRGKDTISMLMAVAIDNPRPPHELEPGLPRALSDLIMSLLAKAPDDRPQSAEDVAEALRRMERKHATGTVQAPLAAAPRRWGVPALTLCAAALLGLGLAAVAAVIVVTVRTPDGKQTEVTAPTGSKVAVDPKGGVTVTLPGDAPAAPDEITNSIGMKLKLIRPGTFTMGSPKEEQGHFDDEGPQHGVEITKAFYMGVYLVTKGQFASFVKEDGYATDTWRNPFVSSKYDQTDNDPVVCASWNDAVKFCAWLSKKEGKTYELPTEAEWEYACRAGTKTAFFFGDDAKQLDDYAWDSGNSGLHTQPVGGKKPNPWGLYDMYGNVYQWCADGYGPYQDGYIKDTNSKASIYGCVFRGGSWGDGPRGCRSAYRGGSAPAERFVNLGFRVVFRPPARSP